MKRPLLPPQPMAPALEKTCAPFPVTLAYLFGSHARGGADAESDIDVAVLAEPGLTREERHRLRLEMMPALAQALGVPGETMDVVVLQDVPLLLQYNVIRSGTLLLARSRAERLSYEQDIEQRYDDELPLLEQETALALDRILAHRP